MPPREQADSAPQMVVVGSPDFNAAVQAAVQAAMQQHTAGAAEPRTVAVQSPAVIPITSIDTTQPGPDDLTVRFNRFCEFQNSGYQRGQEAGFPRAAAEALAAGRAAIIVHDPRRARAA